MNDENWYRTGAAAGELQTSPHKLRGLARAGLVESQVKNGYRYFSGREIERLKMEGLPAMPANTELGEGDGANGDEHPPEASAQPESRPSSRSRVTQELYAEPSRQLARSKEAVIRLEHTLEAKRLKHELRDLDHAAAQRRAQAIQADKRQRWRDAHIQRVIEKVPSQVCAATCARVDELLESVPACSNVSAKVHEIIETALCPVRLREERDRAIEDALRLGLRQSVRQDALLKMAARSEVEKAVCALSEHAGCIEMRAAAEVAVANINAAALHEEKIQREGEIPLFGLPLGATFAELEEARGLVHNALRNRHALPVGASDSQFRKVQDDAIAPVVDRINRRQAEQERQQRDARRRSAIDQAVSFVSLALPAGATLEEVAQATAQLRLALEQLPSNASDLEWAAATESVLLPIRAALEQRREARLDKLFRPHGEEPRVSRRRRRPS